MKPEYLEDATCITCTYHGVGICCRLPPVIITDSTGSVNSLFPEVDDDAWCGEHRKRPPTDEERDRIHQEAMKVFEDR